MFYIAAAVLAIGAGAFLAFGTTERQEWAREDCEKEKKYGTIEDGNSNYVNPALEIRDEN